MKPIYWMLLIWGVLFFLVFLPEKRRKTAAAAHHIKRKGKKEREAMETLAKQFAGKECSLHKLDCKEAWRKLMRYRKIVLELIFQQFYS